MKDVPAKSGAEADETILKKDLAAAEAPAADTVDSDKAKAMFAAHEPSPNAAAHEPSPNAAAHEPSPKLARPTMPTAPTGAIKKDIPAAKSGAAASFDETGAINDPALKPVSGHRRRAGFLAGHRRRRAAAVDQGVSGGEARPGGERLALCAASGSRAPNPILLSIGRR